ncbi:chymotrypsin-like protease CTRL-1 [Drosophila santomea]|uniref:chymotrypsin-like protease CTRL-1 n=1 Tax=Drosophila santomea TaxID=129105 RepID=UPI0019546FE2|nr:chymotrypsin-like protease CTRL-1 [Drosophila santomea]
MMKYIPCLLISLIIGSQLFYGLALLLDPNCGKRQFQWRIIHGVNAELNSTPWMVFLHNYLQFLCGGSLITREFVLTAAHCVMPIPKNLTARLGEYDWRREIDCKNEHTCAPKYEEYMVSRIYTHASYRSAGAYDIALLKLHQPVEYTDAIRPICLVTYNYDNQWYSIVNSAKEFNVTGWGATQTEPVSHILQTARLTQIDREVCHDQHRFSVDHTHICAGNSNSFPCIGDSGSPLGMEVQLNGRNVYAQVGLVSRGDKSCDGVTVFTNILSFTEWIANTISYDGKYMS